MTTLFETVPSPVTEMSDNDFVLLLLKNGAKLSCYDLTYGTKRVVMNLRSRISELKSRGYNIQSEMVNRRRKTGKAARVAQYTLINADVKI